MHVFTKLLGTKGIATRNKKLLGAPGLTTRSKDATSSRSCSPTRDRSNSQVAERRRSSLEDVLGRPQAATSLVEDVTLLGVVIPILEGGCSPE